MASATRYDDPNMRVQPICVVRQRLSDSSIKQMDKQMYMQKVPYSTAVSKHLERQIPLEPEGAVDDPGTWSSTGAYAKEQMEMTAAAAAGEGTLVAEGPTLA